MIFDKLYQKKYPAFWLLPDKALLEYLYAPV